MKKLAFVWDFTVDPIELHTWNDGLNQALRILSSEYGYAVKIIADDNAERIYKEIEQFEPDVILGWGSLDRPSFAGLNQFNKPVALCFAGGTTSHPHLVNFDLIFCENKVYLEAFENDGRNAMIAFGVNDYLFQPMKLSKKFDSFYAAAYAKWKRHELFAEAVGKKGIVAGKIIDAEIEQAKVCEAFGCVVLPQLPYYALPYLYNQSHTSVVTATSYGGSQRSTLEAMACNVVPIVMADSDKNREFVEDSGYGLIVTPKVEAIQNAIQIVKTTKKQSKAGREYIKAKYSADIYAKKLDKGLRSI